MRSSRQRLDLSTSGSPDSQMSPFGSPGSERTYDISITNAIKLQHDIKEKLDFIISGGDSIELQRVGSDLMKIINSALQKAPETKPSEKPTKPSRGISSSSLRGSSSTPRSQSTGRIARGIMRNPAADDRSIAENHSHLELRESNRILENFLSALPVYQAENAPALVENQKVRKARSLIPPKPQPEVVQVEVVPPRRLTVLSLFFGIPGDSMYTRCLGFADKDFLTKEIQWDYFAFKASDLNFPMVSFILLIGCFMFLLRLNYSQLSTVNESPVFVAAVVSSVLAAVCTGIIIFNRLTLLSHKYNLKCLKALHLPMIQLMKSYYGQLADDGVLLLCSLTGALCLFSSILPSESCGAYFSNLHFEDCEAGQQYLRPSPEAIIFNMVVVLFVQGFANSASRHAVLAGWVISILSTNISIHLGGPRAYFWVNVEYLMLLCVSYEFERHTLRHFIKSMLAVDISETNSRLSLAIADQKITDGEIALNSKASVVRHVTHEVRTPLNTVAIGADVLTHEVKQLGDLIPPVMMELVVGIKEASAAALEVVNELLAFEKISAGMFTIEPVATSLFPFLKHCMQQHFIPALAKEIKLILGPSVYTEIMVNIDPTKMTIVMRNILSNAIKFSKVGMFVVVSVEVMGFEEGGMVVISVKDSGAGLSKENASRLFQEGLQFNANALQDGGGSGFGLFISKAIVELHEDGCIWADSEGENLGSTFYIQLTPLALDVTQLEVTVSSEPEVEESTITPLRILVVDDSVGTRKMLVHMLAKDHHVCVQAEHGLAAVSEITRSLMRRSFNMDECSPHPSPNQKSREWKPGLGTGSGTGLEAQAASVSSYDDDMDTEEETKKEEGKEKEKEAIPDLTRTPFDMVLMDSSMHVMTGPEASRQMRKIGYMGPIIGVTGDADTEEFLASGADMVLLKPISVKILKDAMIEVLARKSYNTSLATESTRTFVLDPVPAPITLRIPVIEPAVKKHHFLKKSPPGALKNACRSRSVVLSKDKSFLPDSSPVSRSNVVSMEINPLPLTESPHRSKSISMGKDRVPLTESPMRSKSLLVGKPKSPLPLHDYSPKSKVSLSGKEKSSVPEQPFRAKSYFSSSEKSPMPESSSQVRSPADRKNNPAQAPSVETRLPGVIEKKISLIPPSQLMNDQSAYSDHSIESRSPSKSGRSSLPDILEETRSPMMSDMSPYTDIDPPIEALTPAMSMSAGARDPFQDIDAFAEIRPPIVNEKTITAAPSPTQPLTAAEKSRSQKLPSPSRFSTSSSRSRVPVPLSKVSSPASETSRLTLPPSQAHNSYGSGPAVAPVPSSSSSRSSLSSLKMPLSPSKPSSSSTSMRDNGLSQDPPNQTQPPSPSQREQREEMKATTAQEAAAGTVSRPSSRAVIPPPKWKKTEARSWEKSKS